MSTWSGSLAGSSTLLGESPGATAGPGLTLGGVGVGAEVRRGTPLPIASLWACTVRLG